MGAAVYNRDDAMGGCCWGQMTSMTKERRLRVVNQVEAILISVDEVQKHFTAYVRRIEAGQAFIITKEGKPLAEIRPVTTGEKPVRPFGLCAGQFVVPDNFDAPLSEQILQDFEGL